MKCVRSVVAGLLAGVPVYSQAQVTFVETAVSYMPEGYVDMGSADWISLTDVLGKVYKTPQNPGKSTVDQQPGPPPASPSSGNDNDADNQESLPPPRPPPGGGGGGGGRNSDDDGGSGLPETVMIFSVQVNLQQLIQALISLIIHASPEQLQVIEQQLEQLRTVLSLSAIQGGDEVDGGNGDEEKYRHTAEVSRSIAEALAAYQMEQVMDQAHMAHAVGHTINAMLNDQGLQQPFEQLQQILSGLGHLQNLQDSLPAPVAEQSEGAVGGVDDTDGPTGLKALNAWYLIMLTLIQIEVPQAEPQD